LFELTLRAPEPLVERLSDALVEELDALAVTVEDADAGTAGEQALFGEPGLPPPAAGWQRSTLRALFEDLRHAEAATAALQAQPWRHEGEPLQVGSIAPVPDADWVRLTQSQFAPVPVTPQFWIVPSWHEPPAGAEHVIRLDPGLAFGTGTHPTTRMCLRWIARHADPAAPWGRVLDYGCGSGILAIAAAKFGARAVDAVDIDPAAVQASTDNARRNGVVLRCGAADLAQGRYDLVLANILASPLELLAPLLAGHLAPHGALVLAGILERQADSLQQAYAAHQPVEVLDRDDGWLLMGGTRPGDRR
jgi:ribosomal protein L11 methyltransferase